MFFFPCPLFINPFDARAMLVACAQADKRKRLIHHVFKFAWFEEHQIQENGWGLIRITGEYLDSPVNQYGEPAKGKLFGPFDQGRYGIARTLRWEIKRLKKAEPEINPGSSWLDRLKQLTQVRIPSEAEIAALPDDPAYVWEKLSGEAHPPPWSSVNNCTGTLRSVSN
ncbi:hypothetical protein KUV44_01065 [Marinobacter daepoensis]|uniref:Uncharacterized protein n=1 Tax=Marinobacter daepoensis TaxID=262077 RepID=A0ABS3BBN8_9GAMM|nr:hypothetical protein [Marinobacter daepoensis]MBN7769034.1 hypothetical protein [Marinobacter daepoensis]MBY6077724.1 hypothetical protein [Marinobacter daepoensis]